MSSARLRRRTGRKRDLHRVDSSRMQSNCSTPQISLKRHSRSTPSMSNSVTTTMQENDKHPASESDSDASEDAVADAKIIDDVQDVDDWLLGTPKYGLRSDQLTDFSTSLLGQPAANTQHVFFGDDTNLETIPDENDNENDNNDNEKDNNDVSPPATQQLELIVPTRVIEAPQPPVRRYQRGRLRVHPEKLRQEANRQRLQQEALARRGSLYSSMSTIPSKTATRAKTETDLPFSRASKRQSGAARTKPKRRAKAPISSSLKKGASGLDLLKQALLS